jgi:hypothetical protein
MKKRTLVTAGMFCCAVALMVSIGSQNVFPQNARRAGVTSLPAGFTIPPQDQACILSGNRLDLQLRHQE